MKIHLRLFQTWIIFLVCISLYSSSLAQENLPAIIKKIAPSVVLVLAYDDNRDFLGQGSGFFISKDGVVVTNRHVLEGINSAEIKTADGNVYPIDEVVAEDKDHDLIQVRARSIELALKFKQNTVRPLSISTSYPEVGERIIVIGSPLGLEQTVSDGIVSAIRKIPEFGNIIQITAPISPGSSGSPVVNMKGEVIGVATLQSIVGQNLNFAISGERLAILKPGSGEPLADYWITAKELFRKGLSLFREKDYEKALYYFKKVVQRDETFLVSSSIYDHIGESNYALGRYTEAIEAFKKAISLVDPHASGSIFWYHKIGLSYNALGNYIEAIDAYKMAINEYPTYAEAHFQLGFVYFKLGDWDSGVKEYRILKDLNGDLAHELYNIAMRMLNTAPPLSSTPKAKNKETLQEHDEPQAEKKEGMSDWWKKNRDLLILPKDPKEKLNIPPPPHLPYVQEKDTIQEEIPQTNEENKITNLEENSQKTIEQNEVVNYEIYFDIIRDKIRKYWSPSSNLTVIVVFKVEPSGKVVDIVVEKSSGNSSFDESAIMAVRNSNPLPPFPERLKEEDLRVHLTFTG